MAKLKREMRVPRVTSASGSSRPMPARPHAKNEVDDVRHVVAVPLVDEETVPDQLLGGRDPYRLRGEHARTAVLVPPLVDERDAVPHAVDEVDEPVAGERLRQPVQLLEAHDEPCLVQRARGSDDERGLDEEIEVFRLPVDAGVLIDGIGAGNHVRHSRVVQRLQRAPVHFAFFFWNPEVSVCQRLPFFCRQASRTPPMNAWQSTSEGISATHGPTNAEVGSWRLGAGGWRLGAGGWLALALWPGADSPGPNPGARQYTGLPEIEGWWDVVTVPRRTCGPRSASISSRPSQARRACRPLRDSVAGRCSVSSCRPD